MWHFGLLLGKERAELRDFKKEKKSQEGEDEDLHPSYI